MEINQDIDTPKKNKTQKKIKHWK